MKTPMLAAVLITFTAPALAQSTGPAQPQAPTPSASQMPMGQMMQGREMMGHGMAMGHGMKGQGRGMMGRFSREDMSAFADAHIAAMKTGLRLTVEQERLWPPVEDALRNLANLHLSHRQAMRQVRGMMTSDPVGLLRRMADHMSQGADAMGKLADAAAPLYATLDEAQKRRLQVLVRMGSRGMMGFGGGGMMGGWSDNDDGDGD
ncbi:Spy/CpxP family protein refolding chaperone [Microvirga makkahensis]|uniref:LTXXQ motif family protein n=1 Tax=Microvirga makkahensis TaxID=1128670 RepID=A0A7X3SRE7_9HYPH|nr:Spy/CpxP family protein refolding chaperone [Microvirga makkahensis]MXQ14268.1 LTXXQ motif family protein [Microvirga makkahensis]